jgi:hypothetical protein
MRRFPIWLLIVICILIVTTGLSIYFYRFHSGLSFQQGVYGTFGDYLNPFLTFISIVLLSYISIRANQLTETFNQIQLQPHLYLTMERSTIVAGDEDWIICNGYDAPGINILVRMTFNRTSGSYTRWVNCFSLGKDLKKEMVWVRWADEIQVMCSDISGRRFFSIIYRDWTGIVNINVPPRQYTDALQIARSHGLNTNDLVSRDFQNHFFGGTPTALTQASYEQYLRQRGLL